MERWANHRDGAAERTAMVSRRMTGYAAYAVKVMLRFLGPGRYTAHLFADSKDAKASYEAVVESTVKLTAGDALELAMRPAGGAAVWIEPAE